MSAEEVGGGQKQKSDFVTKRESQAREQSVFGLIMS
jgi:hypothetical protein